MNKIHIYSVNFRTYDTTRQARFQILSAQLSLLSCTVIQHYYFDEYILCVCVCVSPVPFRLPKLLDLSEWELLLASPAEPDFALFPFSRIQTRSTET